MKWLETWAAFRGSHSFESTVVAWSVHALVVVLIAWLIAEVIVRHFAIVRYGVWIITCFSLLSMAVVSGLASPLAIHLCVLPERVPVPTQDEMFLGISRSRTIPTLLTHPMAGERTDASFMLAEKEPERASTVIAQAREAALSRISNEEPSTEQVWQLQSPLVSAYAVGLVFFISRLVLGCVQLSRLTNRSTQIPEARMDLVRRSAREIGLSSCPTCLQSDEVTMPMAIGFFRPTILLPANLVECDFAVQRHCILHELAHIHHRDSLWNLLGEITRAIYWFHPGIYLVRKKLAQAREYVADDHTLQCCKSPSEYSRTLLTLNRIVGDQSTVSMEIGAAAHVERRIRRVLHPQFRTRHLPRWVLLFPAVVLVVMSVCAFQLERAVAQQPAEVGDSLAPSDTTKTTNQPSATVDVVRSESLYDKFDRVALDEINLGEDYSATVSGQVTDKGAPVSDAIVLLRLAKRGNKLDERIPIVARARTDKTGRYKAHFRHSSLSASSKWYRLEVLVADKQGRLAMDVRQFTVSRPKHFSAQVDVSMDSNLTLSATIESQAGQPLGGARVSIQSVVVASEDIINGSPFSNDPFGRPFPSPEERHEFRFPGERISPVGTTDDDGRFEFSGAIGLILSAEKEGLYRRTFKLHDGTGLRPSHQDSHLSPAVIALADEVNVSTEVIDSFGNRVEDYKIQIRNVGRRLRQRQDGSIATAESYLLESANDKGQSLVGVTFPESSGLVPIVKWVDVRDLLRSRHLRIETAKGVLISGRVVKSDTGTGLKSVGVRWRYPNAPAMPTLHYTPTDAEGYWELLSPRRRGVIEIGGTVPGYDLGGGDRVNKADRGLSQEVNPGDATELSLPNFQVRPIPTRTVVVVDTSGRPVGDADVSARHTVTIREIDGKEHEVDGSNLAKATQTDDGGTCELSLTQTTWKDGVVRVSRTLVPDDARQDRDTLIQSGQSEIKPNSGQPIKVVVHDHVRLRGRVLVNGKPHPTIRVGIATRSENAGAFSRYNNGFFETRDGLFEFQMEPIGEYAIMVCLLADESNGERHYYHQTPITKSNSKIWDAGTINIRLNQLKEISSD